MDALVGVIKGMLLLGNQKNMLVGVIEFSSLHFSVNLYIIAINYPVYCTAPCYLTFLPFISAVDAYSAHAISIG